MRRAFSKTSLKDKTIHGDAKSKLPIRTHHATDENADSGSRFVFGAPGQEQAKRRMAFGEATSRTNQEQQPTADAKRFKGGAFVDVCKNKLRVARANAKPSKPTAVVKPQKIDVSKAKTLKSRPVGSKPQIPVPQPIVKPADGSLNLLSNALNNVHIKDLPDGVEDVDKNDKDPYSCADYAGDIVQYVKNLEGRWMFTKDFLEKCPVKASSRGILVDWLIQVQSHLHIQQQTLHLCVAMLDHFLMRKPLSLPKIQLLGITCLLLAAKYEERFTPTIEKLLHLTDYSYTYNEVIRMELLVLNVLSFGLHIPTSMVFLDRGVKVVDRSNEMELLCRYILDIMLPDFKILAFPASLRAAGAIYLAKQLLDHHYGSTKKNWIRCLEYYLGYSETCLKTCMQRMARLLCKAETDRFQGAREKYSQKAYGEVSKWTFLKGAYLGELACSLLQDDLKEHMI